MGLGKFLVCSELFYHYTNTRYVSFLSSLLPLDLTGRSCAVSSPLSAWPARGRDGYCKVYHFCTIQPASLTLTHTHSLTHSLTHTLSLSSADCFVMLIVLFGHVISITPHRLHLTNLLLIYNPTPPFQQPLLHCGGELAEPRSNYGLEVVGSLSRCGWHRFRATGKDRALFPGRNLGGFANPISLTWFLRDPLAHLIICQLAFTWR